MVLVSRSGWATLAVALVVLVVRGPDAAEVIDQVRSPVFPSALLGCCELVLLLLSSWAALSLGLCACGGTVGRLAVRLLPRVLRGALLVGVAGALTVAPAHAEAGSAHPLLSGELDGLRLPDRPATAAPPEPDEVDAVQSAAPRTVVVQEGDSLWSLAAQRLDSDATAQDVAAATARWHRANRSVIGDDPDLVHPGQRLVVPVPEGESA